MRIGRFFLLIYGLSLVMASGVLMVGHQQSTGGEWMLTTDVYDETTGRLERTYVFANGHHYTVDLRVPIRLSEFPRSPNGRWIAFPDDRHFGQIVRANPDGTQRRVLTELESPPVYYTDLVWSPNSEWIAVSYAVNTFSSPRLTIARADGEPATIFSFGGRKDHFVWSPDSQWLAFVSTFDFQEGGNVAIVRTRPDGTDYERFTRSELEFIAMPHITSDSEWIILLGLHQGSWNIYRLNILDLHLEQLAGDVANGSLSLSPNGEWMAYLSVDSGAPALFRMRPDGSAQAQLMTEGSLGFRSVQWSPDGKLIYILANEQVHELDVETGAVKIIAMPLRPNAIKVVAIPNLHWRRWLVILVGICVVVGSLWRVVAASRGVT